MFSRDSANSRLLQRITDSHVFSLPFFSPSLDEEAKIDRTLQFVQDLSEKPNPQRSSLTDERLSDSKDRLRRFRQQVTHGHH